MIIAFLFLVFAIALLTLLNIGSKMCWMIFLLIMETGAYGNKEE